jgi:hypothetical protein
MAHLERWASDERVNPKPSCSAYFDGASIVICTYRYSADGNRYEDDPHRAFELHAKNEMQAFLVEVLTAPIRTDKVPNAAIDRKANFNRLAVKSGREAVERYQAVGVVAEGNTLIAYATRRESPRQGWLFKPEPLKRESWRDGLQAVDLLFEAFAACE